MSFFKKQTVRKFGSIKILENCEYIEVSGGEDCTCYTSSYFADFVVVPFVESTQDCRDVCCNRKEIVSYIYGSESLKNCPVKTEKQSFRDVLKKIFTTSWCAGVDVNS